MKTISCNWNLVLGGILVLLILASLASLINFRYQTEYMNEKLAYIQFSNDCFLIVVNQSIAEFRLISRDDICNCLIKQEEYLLDRDRLFIDFKKQIAVAKEENCNKTLFNIVFNETN